MKKLLTILFTVMISIPAFSQFLSFGVKAGTESSTAPKYNCNYSLSSKNWHIGVEKNTSWGFQGGIFTRVKIFNLFVQPEVIFASNLFEYMVGSMYQMPPFSSFSPSTTIEFKSQRFNRLSVPILAGIKFGPLRFNAGPAANIQIGSPKALIDAPNFKNMYKSAVWGYQAGVGVDILKKLTFDARYAGSLGRKFGDSVTIGTQDFKLDHNQKSFLLSVGLMF